MLVMPSNSTGERMRGLNAEYPGQLGHLFSPDGWFTPWLPYALDNGAYSSYKNGERWKQREYLGMCEKAVASGTSPRWLLVPDVVANRGETLRSWESWWPSLSRWYGWPLAFAVQDDMTPADIPQEAAVLFIGGSVEWKRRQLREGIWTQAHPRVHVGKINGYGWLWLCAKAGVESCDGTGWFMGDPNQTAGLYRFLAEWKAGHRSRPHGPLFDEQSVA